MSKPSKRKAAAGSAPEAAALGRVVRSNLVASDLLEIWLRISGDNPSAADRTLDAIDERCQFLAGSPEIGRPREELAPRLRSSAVGRYVIFYRPMTGGIQVVRVLHSARDLEPLLKGH